MKHIKLRQGASIYLQTYEGDARFENKQILLVRKETSQFRKDNIILICHTPMNMFVLCSRNITMYLPKIGGGGSVWIRASYSTKLSCHNRVEQIQFQSIIIIKM